MAEFVAIARAAEEKRRGRITEAIERRLVAMRDTQTCRQCKCEYVPLEELGMRKCRLHPLAPNAPYSTVVSSENPSLWAEHYPCCAAEATDAPCPSQCRKVPIDMRRGCAAADHSDRGLPYVRPEQLLSAHDVNMHRPNEGLARLLHVEPLFLLRRLAEMRGAAQDLAPESLRKLLGTSVFARVLDVRDICDNSARCTTFRVVGMTLRINLRDAYVAMTQRYRLPCGAVQRNFASAPQDRAQRNDATARLQDLVERALGTTPSCSSSRAPKRSDVLLLDSYGHNQAPQQGGARGFVQDEYYDAADIFHGRETVDYDDEEEEEDDRSRQQPSRPRKRVRLGDDNDAFAGASALDMAREISSLVASDEKQTTFYPFVVWTWVG